MFKRPIAVFFTSLMVALLVASVAGPATADHTDPRTELSSTSGAMPAGGAIVRGGGTWTHIKNFPANPGTDLDFFHKRGDLYASSGTLGQGNRQNVGQRFIRLLNDGKVQPTWVADHGSASCAPTNPSGTTGLQHDIVVTPKRRAQIAIDATDATSRCHDPSGGGLELIDVTRLHDPNFDPREIHLTRHAGTSHTVSVDATRPWIVYNSTSDFAGRPWIDVLNIRSCLGLGGKSLSGKRASCRPKVYRIPFRPTWSLQHDEQGDLIAGTDAACHDITTRPGKIYCAGLNATLIFDVRNLTRPNGNIRGGALPCKLVNGTNTGSKVTDCSATDPTPDDPMPKAKGWRFLGTVHHPGRDNGVSDNGSGTPNRTTGNLNLVVPSRKGVSVSHEVDPTPDGDWMFVTDERGGGVVPAGASCQPGLDNPYGNGGIHVYDIRDPSNIRYAKLRNGSKAVWISDAVVPAPTFCTVHVIEQVRDENRIIAAYYSQGIKIVDYFIDNRDRWTFFEVSSLTLPGANTWAAEPFKIVNNKNGTRTYYFMASDIERGIDIYSWTGHTNFPPRSGRTFRVPSFAAQNSMLPSGNLGLILLAIVVLPSAFAAGRKRRLEARRI
jgi:hypothetical protein